MFKDPQIKTIDQANVALEKIEKKSEDKFDEIVKKLNINVAKNKELATEYFNLTEANTKMEKKIKRMKVWRWILIIFLIFPFFILTNKIKKIQPVLEDKTKQAKDLKQQLDKQLAGLINYITLDLAYNEIIDTVWTDCDLELTLKNPQDWEEQQEIYLPENSCVTNLTTGKMFEHPFLIFNRKDQVMYQHTYTGSVSLPYTIKGMNGSTQTGMETIIATVTLPAPRWTNDTKLVYKSSFAPNLIFTNCVTKHQFKKCDKSQQALENRNFNKVCKLVRNDEKDIRVVFTPLAQENFVKLLKDHEYFISKEGNYTIIDLPHNDYVIDQNWFNTFNYDLEVWKENFKRQVSTLAKTMIIFSLPIANLPVYYQMSHKPAGDKTVINVLQAQNDIDYLIKLNNLQEMFETDVIYKPKASQKFTENGKGGEIFTIECHYFHPSPRTEFVMQPSAHHGMVEVPVEVIDYIPQVKTIYLAHTIGLNKKLESIEDNDVIHNGEWLGFSEKPIDKNVLLKKLKK